MITLQAYFMGRDEQFPEEVTQEIRDNARDLVDRVNLLLSWAAAEGVFPEMEGESEKVASGWRPSAINEATSNAAASSTHITAEGIDLRETGGRWLTRWCLANRDALEDVGLWMEDPRWTPTWLHLQKRPPKSGKRVYIPSSKAPLVAALPEQGGVA